MRVVRLDNLSQFAAVNLLSDPGAIGGPVVIPNAIQVHLKFNLGGGKTARCIMYGNGGTTFSPSTAFANQIHTSLSTGAQWTALAAHIAPTASFAGVDLRDVRSAGFPLVASSNAVVPGTSSGTELPNEVALVITERTARVGPQFRGRIFIPGWATTALGTGNTVAAPAQTALQNWANQISAAFSGAGLILSLGQRARQAYTSPKTGTSFPARAATLVPITAMTVRDNHWDSQRKRGLK